MQRIDLRRALGRAPTKARVISEAGTHENVAGLAYITAFAPD